jgi:hypothetical protein
MFTNQEATSLIQYANLLDNLKKRNLNSNRIYLEKQIEKVKNTPILKKVKNNTSKAKIQL